MNSPASTPRRYALCLWLAGMIGCACSDLSKDTTEEVGDVSCGTGQYVYEDRCVVPCPTLNGSLCELDGRPIRLPAPPAGLPGEGGQPGTCSGPACGDEGPSVALGLSHSCHLSETGEVTCYGSDEFGQLGGSAGGAAITGLRAVQIASGTDHSCALLEDGTVRCWGRNDKGQLGDGSEENRATPVDVANVTDAVEISLAGDVSYARLRSGSVLYWGVSWGDSRFWVTTAAPNGLLDAVSIAAGRVNACARIADGSVRCSGNHDGAAGGSSPSQSLTQDGDILLDVVKIGCSGSQACVALRSNGQVTTWGFQRNGVTGRGAFDSIQLLPGDVGLTNVVDIAVGMEHACALGASGEIWCWGRDRAGEMGGTGDQASPHLLATVPTARALWSDAGARSTCYSTEGGTFTCWGDGASEQLSQGAFSHVTAPGQ